MKLTDWYPGGVKPVRPGVYERDYALPGEKRPLLAFCMFDGFWRTGLGDKERAASDIGLSDYQALPWRGVAK